MKFPLQTLIRLLWPRCATHAGGGIEIDTSTQDVMVDVKDLRGDQVITISEDATANSVKQLIAAAKSISIDDISLFYGGVELEGDGLLSDCGITNSTIIVTTESGVQPNCPHVHYDLNTPVTLADYEGHLIHLDADDDDSFSSSVIDETHAGNDPNQIVYICWLEAEELVEAIRMAEITHGGGTPFSTMLQQITKIGRCSSIASFRAKLDEMRTFINFARIRYIALQYPGNSSHAESALHLAYAPVRRNGEWFDLNSVEKARVASLFHHIANNTTGQVIYGCTNPNLGCNFNQINPPDNHHMGSVYMAWYGWNQRERGIINIILQDPGMPANIKHKCLKMISCKIGCVYEKSVYERLSKMLWSCGFIDNVVYTAYPTIAPLYREKEEHRTLYFANPSRWVGYGEWFSLFVDSMGSIQLERRVRTSQHLRARYDRDYYPYLCSTGFITITTIARLMQMNRINPNS